jgi:hypothetical protein
MQSAVFQCRMTHQRKGTNTTYDYDALKGWSGGEWSVGGHSPCVYGFATPSLNSHLRRLIWAPYVCSRFPLLLLHAFPRVADDRDVPSASACPSRAAVPSAHNGG